MKRKWVRSILIACAVGLAPAAVCAAEPDEGAQPIYRAPREEAAPAQDAAAVEIPHYQPPGIGSPKHRTSGGTRGGVAAGVELLAPADHMGITTSAQPTLYWHLTGSAQVRVEFVLRDEKSSKPFVERTLPTPTGPGFQAVSLAELGVSLPIGVDYQWSISLVMDDERRSRDVAATAWVRRVEPSTTLAERLTQSDAAQGVFVYAENGIWYDAFRAASPAQRDGLLAEVGLGALARSETSSQGPTDVLTAH
jgi:hypothetical protein